MNCSPLIIHSILIATSILVAPPQVVIANPIERPNIVFVVADDLGWGDVGFNGNTTIQTPSLDAMANQGLRFNRFYAQPVCSPARASMLTGRNGIRTGIEVPNDSKLANRDITISELAKTQGYATGHFGKWHVGAVTKTAIDMRIGKPGNHAKYSAPWNHGYDVAFASENWMPTYDPYNNLHRSQFPPEDAAFWTSNTDRVPNSVVENRYTADIIMDEAIEFITHASTNNEHFFTTIWFTIPHVPVVSSPDNNLYPDISNRTRRDYYTVITQMDAAVGRLRQQIDDLGISEDTVIIFSSDNGGLLPYANNGPFKGGKSELYEGGVRVPTVVEWEGHIAPGSTDSIATSSDVLPTLLNIWGVDMPDDRPLDGETMVPIFENGDNHHNAVKFRYTRRKSIVDNQYKLITINSGETWQLFDLLNDIGEEHNLINDPIHATRIISMHSELDDWIVDIEKSKDGDDYSTGITEVDGGSIYKTTFRSGGNAFDEFSAPNMQEGEIESSKPYVFVERQLATLKDDLNIDAPGTPMTWNASNIDQLGGQTLSAGTVVDSFLIHFDTNDALKTGEITVRFDQEILGVIASNKQLAASDYLSFGDPDFGTDHDGRQTLWGENSDSITIGVDRKSITANLTVSSNGLDELRIITRAALQNQSATPVSTWNSSASGSWDNTENWSDHPGEQSAVIIDSDSNVMVLDPTMNHGISTLTIGGGAGHAELNLSNDTVVTVDDGVVVRENGFITVSSGTLKIDRWLNVHDGGIVTLSAGTVITGKHESPTSSHTLHIGDQGGVTGNGILNTNMVNHAGNVIPGNPTGQLTINGNFTQDTDGKVQIELNGSGLSTNVDRLIVSGNVTLGGTLQLKRLNGYKPARGDRFRIITAGTLMGTFDSVDGMFVSEDLMLVPIYDFDGHTGVTITATPPGDANLDGFIDITDLGILGANFNLEDRNWLKADFNLDGITDSADLGLLGANWEPGFTLSFQGEFPVKSMNLLIPEPTTLCLFSGSLMYLGRRRSPSFRSHEL